MCRQERNLHSSVFISSSDPTIFAVDDDEVMLAMLRKLGETMGLQVQAYSSAEGFLREFKDQPGCLVTDIHLAGMSGLDLQQELLKRNASLPIIVITGKARVPLAVQAMQNQAVDFLEKPFDISVLGERIRQAIALDTTKRQKALQRSDAIERLSRLTPREREVMLCVVEGLSNKQIASRLQLSEKTIEVHRGNVMRKTAADSVAELVRISLSSL